MNVTTDADRLKIREYFKEALATMRRIEEERSALKDILDVLKEEHEIKPALARKVMRAMEKGNMPEIRAIHDDLEDLYTVATGFGRSDSSAA